MAVASGPEVPDDLPDRIARAVIDKFEKLPQRGKPQGNSWTVLAGIVAEMKGNGSDIPQLIVLSLATGTRCVGVAGVASGRGLLLHDCHAEVLCRRAFHRCLLGEIRGGDPCQHILERDADEPRWRLRPNVRLHFYVSELPCGECTMVPISAAGEGTLGRKHERPEKELETPVVDRNRTGAKPAKEMPDDPRQIGNGYHHCGILRYKSGRSDLKEEARSVSYSCSEKLCRWNHLGWQGALLAKALPEPVTMSSLVIGGPLFDEGFVKKALFERAGPAGDGITTPRFHNTSVMFPCAREALDRSRKVSTIGLSVVWGAISDKLDAAYARSISRGVPGFHDVVIGHSGERQGQARDRRSISEITIANSWVSPLCKRSLAQDALESFGAALGSSEAVDTWLGLSGDEGLGSSDTPNSPKRRRLADEDGKGASGSLSLTYEKLKDALSGKTFCERRERFHAREPFNTWRRKRCAGADHKGVAAVDQFQVELTRP